MRIRICILWGILAATALSIAGNATNLPPTKVAVYVDCGARGGGHYLWLRMLSMADGLTCVPVDAAAIRAGALDHVQLLVMPGGRSPVEAKTLGAEGRDRIRNFIRNGGGYVGTCAGCYLAMASSKSHPNMLHIAPFKDDPIAGGGQADMVVKFLPQASQIAGLKDKTRRILYSGGPILLPDASVPDAKFDLIAVYNSDYNGRDSKPRPSFAGKGAMAVGTYGKGRVFISAVHPEYDRDDHAILRAAFEHVLGRTVAWRYPQRRAGQLAVGVVTDNSLGVETARFLQTQFAANEFHLRPITGDSISSGSGVLHHLDAILVPATAEFNPKKGPLGNNLARTRAFVARGGRIFVWGTGAKTYQEKLNATVVADATAAVAAMRAFANEPPPAMPAPRPPKSPKFRAAIYTDKGGACYPVTRLLAASPECTLTILNAHDIASGALKDFDLIMQPGGTCHGQYTALGTNGVRELEQFVRNGGKYYGICAGAFLASQMTKPERPRMGIVPFRDASQGNYLGWAKTSLHMTEEGLKVFGNAHTNRMVQYWGGPIFELGLPVPDTDVKVLATYRGHTVNTCQPKPVPPMVGKGAILGGRVGKGKVFIQAPHPEKHEDTFDMVISAFKYLTGVTLHPASRDRIRGATSVFFKLTKNKEGAQYFADVISQHPLLDVTYDSDLDQDLLEDVEVAVLDNSKDAEKTVIKDFIARGGRVVLPTRRADGSLDWSTTMPAILSQARANSSCP